MQKTKTLLLNNVYWAPVGHTVEVLHYANAYRVANPSLEISVVLNKRTALDLIRLCPWIKNVYTVDVHHKDPLQRNLDHIPREWDYIAQDLRSTSSNIHAAPDVLQEYYEKSKDYFVARYEKIVCGYTKLPDASDEEFDLTGFGEGKLPYAANQPFRFQLLDQDVSWAQEGLQGSQTKVGILLAGSSSARECYPSFNSWGMILKKLHAVLGKETQFVLFGKYKEDNIASKTVLTKDNSLNLFKNYRLFDGTDIGITKQMALLSECDLLISPHSGFAFTASCVDTPWLALSGGRWMEYYYNRAPFYSVLPDPQRYSAFTKEASEAYILDGDIKSITSMCYGRFQQDLGEIVEYSKKLIEKSLTFEQCMQLQIEKLAEYFKGDISKISSFEDTHKLYLEDYLSVKSQT